MHQSRAFQAAKPPSYGQASKCYSAALPPLCLLALCLLALWSVPAVAQSAAQPVVLQPVEVIATTPGQGGAIEADKVPAFTTSVGASEFETTNSPSLTDTLQQRVPGAVSIDVNGNDFEQEFFYRGFVASPVQGTPQGLAVYMDGVRINEAFGDTVNFDMIPPQAISRADVFTNNPIFGLNALGGAINLQMKNGFIWQGFEAQLMGGSYGRIDGMFQYGVKKDDWAFYISADALHDDGWRYYSPSSLVRVFGDLGYKTLYSEIHIVATGATNNLGVIGTTPVELLDSDWRSTFTSPQTTLNEMGSISINGKVYASPTWTLQGDAYYRHFYQFHQDGNDASLADCSTVTGGTGAAGQLCDTNNGSLIVNKAGAAVASAGAGFINGAGTDVFPYGVINDTRIHTNTVGSTVQATNKDKILDNENQVTFGASIDQSWLTYSATQTLGCLNATLQVYNCPALANSGQIFQDQSGTDYVQTYLSGTTTYVGVFALDTFNVTKNLSLTGGGRFNYAVVATQDQSGVAPELNATNRYQRFNPVIGAAYKITPNLTAYAGYSEANRAPTPLETDCSSSTRPCVLASSLVSDPPLAQVVSHTVEGGFRGNFGAADTGLVNWKVGYFRTENTNDIIQLSSVILGTGYYTNVPETLRQGAEASVNLKLGQLDAYVNYSYVDATYQFTGLLSSPQNPFADGNGNILVTPGDHIPGIPQNQAKLGFDYNFTSKFKAGADVLIVGSQYFIGDDSNQNPQLPLYWVANLHGSYQIADHVQIFGQINNLFDNHYATYGTFFSTNTDSQYATTRVFTGNADTITPAQPLSLYGGVKVTF
jgi:iron complex outermembrane receptor protein